METPQNLADCAAALRHYDDADPEEWPANLSVREYRPASLNCKE